MTTDERFWSKVDLSGGPDACWPWLGSTMAEGYGRAVVASRIVAAHRQAWLLTFGTLPDDDLLHSCDNPPCVNPAHLRAGTQGENNRDRAERGRTARQLGTTNGRAVLDEAAVRRMREARAAGDSYRVIAKAFGVSTRTARLAISGQTWRHVE